MPTTERYKSVPPEEKSPASERRVFTEEEQKILEKKRKSLSSIAYFIGKDFEMPVELNEPGGGWHWDFEKNVIRVDPIDLLEKSDAYLRFVTGHEGAHRRVSITDVIPKEDWQEPGFAFLSNAIEDPRVNNFLTEAYPRFADDMEVAYSIDLDIEKKAKDVSTDKIGYVPKHIQAGFEYIKQWFRQTKGEAFEVGIDLPEDVRAVIEKTLVDAQDSWLRYPTKKEADTSSDLVRKYAEKSYRINRDKIWPEFKTLIEEDIKNEELEQALRDMAKGESEEGGEDSPEGGRGKGKRPSLPKELKDSLSPEDIEALEEALEHSDKGSKPVPSDKLPDSLKEKIGEYIDSLPEDKKEELRKRAQEVMDELDKEISEALRGIYDKEREKKESEERGEEKAESGKDAEESKGDKKPPEGEVKPAPPKPDISKLRKEIEEAMDSFKNNYERYRNEVLPIIDKLEDDLRDVFVRRRTHGWESGHKSGKRIHIAKRMQEKAKGLSAFESRAWQRREMPQEKDYAIEIGVDLSGSMRGEKIVQTFKGAIVLAEVLNRLSISNEIVGFNDRLHVFKSFTDTFSDELREKMGAMLQEVNSARAAYNDDGWAVKEMSERLRKEQEDEKFLVILSDGVPEPSAAHAGKEYDLEKVVREIVEEGKEKLIGLGIGSGTSHVSRYYPNSVANVSVQKMAENLADLLREMIEHSNQF